MIYLASPYSDDSDVLQAWRWRAVCRAASCLMKQGHRVFSPIAHTHPIAQHGLPGDWEFWQAWDREMLPACSELWVLKLAGYDQSKGIAAEIALANEMGIPVRFLEPEEAGL